MPATLEVPRTSAFTADRRFGPGGGVYAILTHAADTGGALFAFVATEPAGGGPPLHVHHTEDEFFFVLDGDITFWVDGHVTHVPAGGTAFVPRGRPHCFKNRGACEARVLVVFTPGSVEGFFDYGLPIDGRIPSDRELLHRIEELAPKFGLDVLGPSPL